MGQLHFSADSTQCKPALPPAAGLIYLTMRAGHE